MINVQNIFIIWGNLVYLKFASFYFFCFVKERTMFIQSVFKSCKLGQINHWYIRTDKSLVYTTLVCAIAISRSFNMERLWPCMNQTVVPIFCVLNDAYYILSDFNVFNKHEKNPSLLKMIILYCTNMELKIWLSPIYSSYYNNSFIVKVWEQD